MQLYIQSYTLKYIDKYGTACVKMYKTYLLMQYIHTYMDIFCLTIIYDTRFIFLVIVYYSISTPPHTKHLVNSYFFLNKINKIS